MKNDYSGRGGSNSASSDRLPTYLWIAFSGGILFVAALLVGYGLMISPFLAVGVVALVFIEKRRAKLDAPVRFPQRSKKTERRLARSQRSRLAS